MELVKKLSLIERAVWENIEVQPGQDIEAYSNWLQLTSPFAPTPFMNGVFRCEFSEMEIDRKIQKTVEHFRSKGLPFRWKVVPSSKPKDLGSRLERYGLILKEKLFGLFADPAELEIKGNPTVRVEKLVSELLDDWLSVQITAWKVPPEGISYLRESMTASLKDADPKRENYIAYLEGRPVGSAGLKIADDYAYFVGGAVADDSRRRGVYRALLAHRMNRIRQLGLPVVIHCLETTSAPICLKLGFEKICEIASFEP